MSELQHQLKIFRSLADESRLRIIKVIISGTSNPGAIARAMGKHRSTIEKHLRILLAAGIVQKMPGLNDEGHLQVQYMIKREQEAALREMLSKVDRMFQG